MRRVRVLAFVCMAIGASLGGCALEISEVSEERLVFRWLAAMGRDRSDCDGHGEASASAPPFTDPEIKDGPDGEVFAGREYWHASDTDCMLSLVLELEPTRWLQVERLDCIEGKGCVPAATGLFQRSESGE